MGNIAAGAYQYSDPRNRIEKTNLIRDPDAMLFGSSSVPLMAMWGMTACKPMEFGWSGEAGV